MSRKSTKNYSKLLGGLGAMYALSKLPVGEGVRPEDVNKEDAARDKLETEQRLARLRVDRPPEPATSAARLQPRVKDVDFFQSERDPGLFGVGKKKGGVVSASRRADGIAQRGKTRGKMY